MYVITFIMDFIIFQLLKVFFEDENITTKNNLKIFFSVKFNYCNSCIG